jgi:hypothetical protein
MKLRFETNSEVFFLSSLMAKNLSLEINKWEISNSNPNPYIKNIIFLPTELCSEHAYCIQSTFINLERYYCIINITKWHNSNYTNEYSIQKYY